MCGKTGTVQNPHGKNHSVFIGFAPRDNPKIAVAVIVENAGYGGTYAAPIASYITETYLKGKLTGNRADRAELMKKLVVLPDSPAPIPKAVPGPADTSGKPGTVILPQPAPQELQKTIPNSK